MEDVEPKEEEEEDGDAGEVDPAPPNVGFAMVDVLAEFEVAQKEEASEQQDILDSV